MENEYTIKQLFQIFISKIWLIIILIIVGGGAAFGISKFMMPLEYQSYTSMYVRNNTATSETANGVNVNDLNASKSLVGTYIAILQDDAVMEKVGDALLQKYSADELSGIFTIKNENGKESISVGSIRNCITMAAVSDTEVLKITAVTTNAEISAALCNTIADISPEFLIRVVGAGSVEAIGEARINNSPVSPNILKNTILGAIGGLVISLLLAFALDFFDNTIKDTEVLSQKYKKAVIGEIQGFSSPNGEKGKNKKSNSSKRATLLDNDIPFYITEAYKAMRTNVLFSLATTDKKIIAVSSSSPGEGKSTTAANLAISLSEMNHKVLLIDADMRKPVQHKNFNLKNKNGLSSAISKMDKLENCISKNVTDSLDVLTSGPKPPNPSELLASAQMKEFLEKLSETYDYIIVDTPPINVVSDVLGLSSSISGIVLVLNYGHTTFEDTDNVLNKLKLADINMLGFVLNNIDTKHHVGSYYNYKYKSKYYSYSGYGYGESSKIEADDKSKVTSK